MSFIRRKIDLAFQLGQGSFGDSGFDTVTLSGLRVSANISKAGGVGMSELRLQAFGMTLSQMSQLSLLGKPIVDVRRNLVTVSAGDDVSGMAVAFTGIITESWANMAGAPQTALALTAHTGLLDALRPVPASSYHGQADVAVIMAGLAQQMGYGFTNSGVSVILSNPYFPGTARDQVKVAAAAADINWIIDDASPAVGPSDGSNAAPEVGTGVLAIWPKNGSRGGDIPVISASTGMVGYPTCTQNGIVVKSLYNPSIAFGGQIQVQSELTLANGNWNVFKLEHELESETPGGAWFTTVEGSVLGHEAPIAG